jgi:hypothetical protein
VTRVLGPEEGIVAQQEPPLEREGGETVGLPAQFLDEGRRLRAPWREQHALSWAETAHGIGEGELLERASHRETEVV